MKIECRYLTAAMVGVLTALAIGGCYQYDKPVPATQCDTYTQREKDERDDLFKDIKQLTRSDAQRIALKNNPTYIAAYHAVSAARMRYYQAWGAYSPTVTASFTAQDRISRYYNARTYLGHKGRVHTDTFTTNTTIGATLLVFDGLARESGILAAKHSMEYQKTMEADQCRTMMRAVAVAYNAVLLAIEKRRIAREDRKFQLSSLKDTKYKFDAGAVPLSDVLNFEILASNAEVSMIDADYQYETAIYALAVLMGYPEGTLPAELTFPSDFKSDFGDLPAVEIYLDAALSHRPDLKGYREQLKVARYQLYRSYSAYSPTVSAFANFGFGTNETFTSHGAYHEGGTYVSSYDDRSYYNQPSFTYGFTADWTIFNGFIRYNTMREHQANLASAEYSVAAQWFNVVGEVRSAYANYVQTVRQTRFYEKVLELSQKQRDLVKEEYDAGNAELTRLNEAQRDLVAAETNLAGSYIAIQNAKAQLDSAVGANTAEFYMQQNEDETKGAPGLEALGNIPENTAETDSTTPQDNAAKPAAKTAAKPAAKAAKPAAKTVAEPAAKADKPAAAPGIPASPTAPPPAKSGK
ncbi:MAG: TolC family protein [Lentisphaeria bacterium]|nr:TolC family protein [Lentisphaeria bacterium]